MSETKQRPRAATYAAGALCLLALCLLAPHAATAQWTTNGTNTTTTNNVGVGTSATPEQKLQVSGGDIGIDNNASLTLKDTSGAFRAKFTFTTGNNLQIHNFTPLGPGGSIQLLNGNDTGLIQFFTSSSYLERMRITAGGNVGIGTTGPAEKLHVGGGGLVVSGPTTQSAGVNGLFLGFSGGTTATIDAVQQGTDFRNLSMSSKTFSVKTWNGSALVQGLYQTNAGNVGIGTTTPGAPYKLDVAGSVNASGLCLGGACKASWSEVGGGTSQWQGGAGGTGPVYYSGGSVGIGTATPIRGLHVAGANYTVGAEFVLENTSMPANNRKLNLWGDSTAGSAGRFFLRLLNDAGSAVTRDFLSFDNSTGNVGVGTTSPTQRLDVSGAGDVKARTAGTNSAALQLQESGGTATWSEWQQYSDRLRLNTHDGTTLRADLMSILPGGNVGIGIASPAFRLDVGGQADNLFQVVSSGSGATDTVAHFSSAVGSILMVRGNGRVGIGVDPTQKLDVAGSVKATGFCLGAVCKSDWSEVGGGTSQWQGGAGGTGPIYYGAGNVGVGTTTPGYALDVVSGSQWAARFKKTDATHGGVLIDSATNTNPNLALSVNGAIKWYMNNNVSKANSLQFWEAAGSYPRFTLTQGGNVGIGTETPGRALEVAREISGDFGGLHIYNASGAPYSPSDSVTLSLGRSSTHVMGQVTASNKQLGTFGDGYLAFSTRRADVVTERVRIDEEGRVGIGTATPGAGLADPNVKLDVQGSINVSGNISAKYQDVAEWVPSVQRLAAGTVVVLDAGRTNHVLASSSAYDTKVAGVVSSEPGVILGVGGEGKLKVATTGRVRVKVDATRAPIRIGDLIVTSDAEGMAMRSEPVSIGGRQFHAPGTIIGKALEPLESGVGEILVLLSLQ